MVGWPTVSFFRYQGMRNLEVGAKYGAVATPSLSLAVGGGDEKDISASAVNEMGV